VTLNFGMAMPSWYDIIGLDERSNESCEGIDDTVETILGLIQDEVNAGIDYGRIVLSGFSQGGAVALHTGMRSARPGGGGEGLGLAGICVMSGYLPLASSFEAARGSERTPILHCHGTADQVVNFKAAGLSRDRVTSAQRDAGVPVEDGLYEVRSYPIEHSVSMDELDDVAEFMTRVIPPN